MMPGKQYHKCTHRKIHECAQHVTLSLLRSPSLDVRVSRVEVSGLHVYVHEYVHVVSVKTNMSVTFRHIQGVPAKFGRLPLSQVTDVSNPVLRQPRK